MSRGQPVRVGAVVPGQPISETASEPWLGGGADGGGSSLGYLYRIAVAGSDHRPLMRALPRRAIRRASACSSPGSR